MDGQQNAPQQPGEPTWQFKPGETISPRSADPATSRPVAVPPSAPTVSPQLQQPTPASGNTPATPLAAPVNEPATEPAPTPAVTAPTTVAGPLPSASAAPTAPTEVAYWQGEPSESISWTASEYVAHHKTAGWHVLVVAAALVFALIVWLLTKDFMSTLVIVTAGAMLSFYGARRPRQVQYHLDHEGLTVGQKHFMFEDFRSFSVVPEGVFSSITLMPLKRFALLTTLYYDPADEERIFTLLSDHLPHEDPGADVLGTLMRRIRF